MLRAGDAILLFILLFIEPIGTFAKCRPIVLLRPAGARASRRKDGSMSCAPFGAVGDEPFSSSEDRHSFGIRRRGWHLGDAGMPDVVSYAACCPSAISWYRLLLALQQSHVGLQRSRAAVEPHASACQVLSFLICCSFDLIAGTACLRRFVTLAGFKTDWR